MTDLNWQEVDVALAEAFGRHSEQWRPADPMVRLVERVLGQRTTNAHVRRAMENLWVRCASWAEVAALPHDELTDLVRPAGLARQKAGAVQAIVRQVLADSGQVPLDFLPGMTNEAAVRYLTGLPGVGAHTAALVLMFALGRPGVMPVETHVHRVARRLGWAEPAATPAAVQRAIEAAAPDANLMDLHVNLVRLGQRHCTAGTPDCPDCPASGLCRSARLQPWWG